MSSSTPSTPVVDLLTSMTLDSIEASSLQPRELMIARIAALVAVDAPTISYSTNLESAVAVGIDVDRVRGILTAIAPIVGTARVASATGKIAEALAIELVEFDG
jgi:4-carboxymuconolactone decarboxylase